MKVDPPGSKAAKLARIRLATADELTILGHRDMLIQEAREAEATTDEIRAAFDAPRER
jgi:hypothetical protein